VVASASIDSNRRQRRAKSEALDGRQVLRLLRRSAHGARDVWRVVRVPSVEVEDQRHRHRALDTLKQERARTPTRIQGVLRSQGVRLTRVHQGPEPLEALRL
jgi:transposase